MRYALPSSRAASALPTPTDNPCPSEPVDASIPGREPLHGVPLHPRVHLPKRLQLAHREVAGLRERRVQRGHAMALRQDEAVAVGPLGVLRIVSQHASEIERGDDVDGGERASGMSAVGGGDHLDDVHAQRARDVRELGGGDCGGRGDHRAPAGREKCET